MKSTPAVSVRGGPAQARLIPNSLLTKPLPGGAQVVMETERALGRENPPSFFFPITPCSRHARYEEDSGQFNHLQTPPPLTKNRGERFSSRFFSDGRGGGTSVHRLHNYNSI